MNIADDPTQVSGGGTWRVNDTLRRIPIILTGEPLSILHLLVDLQHVSLAIMIQLRSCQKP